MSPLQRILIEKTGNDNGFEYVLASEISGVSLASARHPNHAFIDIHNGVYHVRFLTTSQTLVAELQRSFPLAKVESSGFSLSSEAHLAALLRRAARLSRALPSQAASDYQKAVSAELAALPAGIVGTEVERLVRQRVGQAKFRDAMLDYWDNACAVTGVAVPEVLRASHAKPWAECTTDAERLDVFNGFLLNANLDALFDRFLISFDEQGALLIGSSLSEQDLIRLGITPNMALRSITHHHQEYLSFHRARFISLNQVTKAGG